MSSIGTIMSHTSTATGRLTCATVASPMTRKTPGSSWPSAMPTMMQSATQKVRKRSNTLIAGLGGAARSAVATDSLMTAILCFGGADEREQRQAPAPALNLAADPALCAQRLSGLDHG